MYTIYGRPNCGWCIRAKGLLSSNNVEYKYIDIYEDSKSMAWIKEKGYKTVPQIFEDDEHIGGYNELVEYYSDKGLVNFKGEKI